LVFSSLHTKDAVSTIVRLEEIGVEKYQISSALLLVVAQRLVRVLCKDCREPYQPSDAQWKELGHSPPAGAQKIYRARGCAACENTGYQGRTGIFELLPLDDELRRAINENVNEQKLWELAWHKGYRPYREDGLEKVVRGVTTLEEVLHAG
jgi:general secretion pathway protein E